MEKTENILKQKHSKAEYVTFKDLVLYTGKSQDRIKDLLLEGKLFKYDSNHKKLKDPVRNKGRFKKSEIETLFNIKIDKSTKPKKTFRTEEKHSFKEIISIPFKDIDKIYKYDVNTFDVGIQTLNFSSDNLESYKENEKVFLEREKHLNILKKYFDLLKEHGILFLVGTLDLLPYFAVEAETLGFIYRDLITVDFFDVKADNRFKPVSLGILFLLKRDKKYRINRLLNKHRTCNVCKKPLKDWGGKKDLKNPNGTALTDVWKYLIQDDDSLVYQNYKPFHLPKVLVDRLINLTAFEEYRCLIAPFNGYCNGIE